MKSTLDFNTCKNLIVGLKNGGYDDDQVAKVFENLVNFGWVRDSTSIDELKVSYILRNKSIDS